MNTNKKQDGKEGEDIAVEWLTSKGYQIITRNYTPGKNGEIDIIAKDPDDGFIVFVEVKMRKSLEYREPEYGITAGKKNQVKRVAIHYLFEKDLDDIACRFDVIAILKLPRKEIEINHYRNAFE